MYNCKRIFMIKIFFLLYQHFGNTFIMPLKILIYVFMNFWPFFTASAIKLTCIKTWKWRMKLFSCFCLRNPQIKLEKTCEWPLLRQILNFAFVRSALKGVTFCNFFWFCNCEAAPALPATWSTPVCTIVCTSKSKL